MKRILFFATIVATFVLASCQKEDSFKDKSEDALVFTATIDNADTKTTINTNGSDATNRGKIAWVAGDEITITDAESNSVVYVAQSSGQSTTFKEKSGQSKSLETGSTYSAVYGSAPNTTQAYGDYYSDANQAKNIYMTSGDATSSTSFTFTAACSLLKLTLTAGTETDKTISKIEIFGTSGDPSTNVIYTLNCSDAQSIESAKDFYIALPEGSYSVMKFTNSTGHICYKTAKSAMVIENNKIQPVTLTGIVFNDMLPGKFTVNDDNKKVHFSRGNLYYDGFAFHSESNQYAYQSTYSSTWSVNNHISHFYWTKTADASYAKSYSDGTCATNDRFFADGSDDDHMLTLDGKLGWYVLSSDEWNYLIGTRTVNEGGGEGYSYQRATINSDATGVYGMILYPDDYTSQTEATSYTSSDWSTMEKAGCVFLPAAGFRYGSSVDDAGDYGCYWSSTPDEEDVEYASFIPFGSYYDPGTGTYYYRSEGYSVRLVRE